MHINLLSGAYCVPRPCCALPSGAASMWFMVWAVDRLGRSLPDLVGTMQELHGTKVDPFVYVLPRLPVGDQSSRRPPSTRAPSSVRPYSRRRLIRRLLPSGDDAHALAGLGVVGDEREVPAELDDGRQLAAFVIRAADRGGGAERMRAPVVPDGQMIVLRRYRVIRGSQL